MDFQYLYQLDLYYLLLIQFLYFLELFLLHFLSFQHSSYVMMYLVYQIL